MNKIIHIKGKDKVNRIRWNWMRIYLCRGVLLLIAFLVVNYLVVLSYLDLGLLRNIVREILWCLSWSAFGIGISLYNTREANDKRSLEQRHYSTYFLFVWGIATLSAFVALRSLKNDIIGAYAAALLAGVIIGFTGDKLGERLNLVK
jgi:hypothetical protein